MNLEEQFRDRGYRLVEQRPDVPPRYRFRPRGDHYTLPRFEGEPRLDVERYEPLEWRELADPTLIASALLVVFAAVLVIGYFLTSAP